MNSLILWGLVAFLIVDILLLALYLRWEGGRTRSNTADALESQAPAPPVQAAKANVPTTTLPDEPTVPLSGVPTQPTRGEHVFTFDLANDEPGREPGHDGSPQSASQVMQLTKDDVDDDQLSHERNYLRQKASNLETRIAALNESTDTTSDYQRGMRAVLEEELHATWTRLAELESEAGRVNHAAAK